MQDLQFPLNFRFKISTLANDFTATDANGKVVAYVKQKMFKLKENIVIYADESQSKTNYRIKADRWLDFNAAYTFYDANENTIGKVVRKGWRSLWNTKYELIDQFEKAQYNIREEKAWVKVADGIFGEIPILGMLTGYLFNPTYLLKNRKDEVIVKLKKQPSFWGREFLVEKVGTIDNDDDDRIMLGLIMMILLERRRG